MRRKLHVRFGGESLVSKGLYSKGWWLILHNQLYNAIITAHAILMRCDNVFILKVSDNLTTKLSVKEHSKAVTTIFDPKNRS